MAAWLIFLRRICPVRAIKRFSIISLFAMGDSQNEHGFLSGVDPIDNPIIAGSESVQSLEQPDQLFDVWMVRWIVFQQLETRHQFFCQICICPGEEFLGFWQKKHFKHLSAPFANFCRLLSLFVRMPL
jgi:hypothetical protein